MPITFSHNGPLGDGSDAQGGVAPALTDGTELPDHPSTFDTAEWKQSGSRPDYDGTNEAKFRTHCNPSHVKQVDPIVFPGVSPAGHMHQFFGNTLTDENSTYESLRTTGASTCAGGPMNRTAYWHPAMYKVLPSGAHVIKKPDYYTVYYPAFGSASKLTRLPRGFRYVAGYDMTRAYDVVRPEVRTALDAANAIAGYSKFVPLSVPEGVSKWQCSSTGKSVKYLRGPNGEDMLEGCPASSSIVAWLRAPRCWNGRDLSSPDGRGHVIYQVHDNGTLADVCPDGYYLLPDFQLNITFSHDGPDDYMSWYLSSDRMNAPDTPPDGAHRSPCRKVGPYFCPGETIHVDWFGAWDYGDEAAPGAMLQWMNNCTGVKTYPSTPGNPGDCSDSVINETTKLLTFNDPSPDPTLSQDPVINFTGKTSLPKTEQVYPLPDGTTGDFTLEH